MVSMKCLELPMPKIYQAIENTIQKDQRFNKLFSLFAGFWTFCACVSVWVNTQKNKHRNAYWAFHPS